MPDPLLPLAIEAHSKPDEDKLSQGLSRLVAEDPTMRLEQNQDTHQVVLWCLGEAHVDVALERLRNRYGVQVDAVPHKVSLRETFADRSAGRGRHVKQSGGHGQFAICEIEVEPLPDGSGIEFVDKVVGGAVPRQFIPSVEKGVRAQAAKGVAAGYPSSTSGSRCSTARRTRWTPPTRRSRRRARWRCGRRPADAQIHLLEPVAEVQVLVADDYVGAVMSDLSGRRGRVVGTEQAPGSARSYGPRSRRSRSAGTRWTCGRCRTARGGSAGRTRGTSRCLRSWPTGCANRREDVS